MELLRTLPRKPLVARLWIAATALSLVISVFVAHEVVVRASDGSRRLSLGQDFIPVYAAGTLVREGRSRELYAIEPIARIERRVVADADLEPLPVYGPFLNPPYFAALYAPMSRLPYRSASAVWLALNVSMLFASVLLLCRMLPPGDTWRRRGLVSLLIVLPMPFWQAICHQQNTFLSLLLLTIAVSLWRAALRGRAEEHASIELATDRHRATSAAFMSGVVAGLLFYKPQLALVISAALVLTLGWRALAGLAATGSALLVFTLGTMPGALSAYAHALGPTVQFIQEKLNYNWARQITPLAFWRLLLQGHGSGPTDRMPRVLAALAASLFAVGLIAAVLRFLRRGPKVVSVDSMMAATIVSMPLLMPYYMDYDLLLLAVPAVLLARDWLNRPRASRLERLQLWAWAGLYLVSYVNPGLGSHTRLNLGVPLIAAVAGLSIARCFRILLANEPAMRYDAPVLASAA